MRDRQTGRHLPYISSHQPYDGALGSEAGGDNVGSNGGEGRSGGNGGSCGSSGSSSE